MVFGGSYGIGADVAELAERLRRPGVRFSAGPPTGTHVEDPERRRRTRSTHGRRGDRPDRLRGQHRGRAAHGQAGRGGRRDDRPRPWASTTWPRSTSPGPPYPYLARDARATCCSTPPAPTPAAGPTTASTPRPRPPWSTSPRPSPTSGPTYGVRVNCVNPERTSTPMRIRAFGEEPADTLLSPRAVAQTSLDVLISDLTGQVIDVRLRRDLTSRPIDIHLGPASSTGTTLDTRPPTLDAIRHLDPSTRPGSDSPTAIRRIPTLRPIQRPPRRNPTLQLINIYLGSTRHSAPPGQTPAHGIPSEDDA